MIKDGLNNIDFKSRKDKPRPIYFLAIETTNLKLALIKISRAF